MRPFLLAALAALLLPAPAAAQDLLGITSNGQVYTIDSATGAGSPLGSLGFTNVDCLSKNSLGRFYAICNDPLGGNPSVVEVDPLTGAGTFITYFTPLFANVRTRAMAFDAADTLWIEHSASYLLTLDLATGNTTYIGKPATFELTSMSFVGAVLYGWDETMGLVDIDLNGGQAVDVNPFVSGSNDIQSMATSSSGVLYGAGDALFTVSLSNGQISQVGTGNWSDIVALEFLDPPSGPTISISNLVAGSTATVNVSGAGPGHWVRIGYSLAGAGPTNTPWGPVLLSQPIVQLPPLQANASGNATLQAPIPPIATGVNVWVHGVEIVPPGGILTNALALVVG